MKTTTLPYGHPALKKLVLDEITASAAGLTVRDIRLQLKEKMTSVADSALRLVAAELEDEGAVESEAQARSTRLVYFIESKPPRPQVRRIPVELAGRIHMTRPSSWCSMLGVAA